LPDRLAVGDLRQIGTGGLVLRGDPGGDLIGRPEVRLEPAVRVFNPDAMEHVDLIDPAGRPVGEAGVLRDRHTGHSDDHRPHNPDSNWSSDRRPRPGSRRPILGGLCARLVACRFQSQKLRPNHPVLLECRRLDRLLIIRAANLLGHAST
jgi:hypothetical protein